MALKHARLGPPTTTAVRLTREQFAKISAVEGLKVSGRMAAAFQRFDAEGWSPEQRRAFIRAQFQKKTA